MEDGLLGLLRRDLEHAEAHDRHFDAVVEGDGADLVGHATTMPRIRRPGEALPKGSGQGPLQVAGSRSLVGVDAAQGSVGPPDQRGRNPHDRVLCTERPIWNTNGSEATATLASV